VCRISAIALLIAAAMIEPTVRPGAAIGVLLLLTTLRARQRWIASAVAATVALSAAAAAERDRRGALHPALDGVTVATDVRIASSPVVERGRVSFIGRPLDPTLPPRLRVNWFDAREIPREGECWRLALRLRPVVGRRNPHGYDVAEHARREGWGGAAEVVEGPRAERLEGTARPLLHRLRDRLRDGIVSSLPDDPARAVLVALATGDRGGLDADTRRLFAATGTSHLMAISGLHVGLVALLGYWAGMRCPLPRGGVARDRGVLAGLLLSLGYSALSGFAIPARRAWLVLLLGAVCLAHRRPVDPLRALSLAAVVIIVAEPLALLAPTFALSFGAVLVLSLQHRVRRWRRARWPSWWHGLTATQLLLSLSLAPLTLAYFGEVSVIGAAVNLLMLPLYSFVIVPGVLCAGVLVAAGLAPAAWALALVHAAASGSLRLLSASAALPVATLTPAALPPALLLVLFTGSLVAALAAGMPGRWLGIALFALPCAWRPPPAPLGCAVATMLDVGQGTAIVIAAGRRYFLYDTGPAWFRGGDAGERIVLPYLRAAGITRLDGIIVSHGDADHAGGLRSVTAAAPAAELLAGGGVSPPAGRPSTPCRRGQRWHAGGVTFDMLWPSRDAAAGGRDNDASCVLRLRADAFSLLLTGDVEARAEAALVALGVAPADAVTMPHHGSPTSSTPGFVAQVDANHVLVSSARGNRWGFPDAAVTGRWRAGGAMVWNTADHGALQVRLCAASGVQVMPFVTAGAEGSRR
jgi:competence protein ComEC